MKKDNKTVLHKSCLFLLNESQKTKIIWLKDINEIRYTNDTVFVTTDKEYEIYNGSSVVQFVQDLGKNISEV